MPTRFILALGVEGVSIPDYYQASPIWRYDASGQLSPLALSGLPWADETVSQIQEWWHVFVSAMAWSDPKVRGFKSDEAFNAFVTKGEELAEAIRASLAPGESLEVSLSSPRFVRSAEPQIDKYRIFPDWGQVSPIWNAGPGEGPYNLILDHLKISDSLAREFRRWLNDFLDTFNDDYPPDSGFTTEAESQEFLERGRQLTERFSEELGGNALVVLEYGGVNWIPPSRKQRRQDEAAQVGNGSGRGIARRWPLSRYRRK